MRINISMWQDNAKKDWMAWTPAVTRGRLPRQKFFFGDQLILALLSILSLILYLVIQGEFSMWQDKKI